MWSIMEVLLLHVLCFVHFFGVVPNHAMTHIHTFKVTNAPFTRLCSRNNILTVNGQFPGPTISATKGDTLVINVHNYATENITIHWYTGTPFCEEENTICRHGVKQPRYPWSDGPELVTQCPIRPGERFSQKIVLSDEEGTLWWHAHSDWSRATVHGALIVRPKCGQSYPFPKPHAEFPIIFGEWWKSNVRDVLNEFIRNGGAPNVSDAYLINGQPGDLYPCSRSETYRLTVHCGKTYLMRMINAVMNNILFFSIANHELTVVGTDGAYIKPFKTGYIAISPGQTIDALLEASQKSGHYYMAAKAYSPTATYDNTTTTAILEYNGHLTPQCLNSPLLPHLPDFNDTNASVNFTRKFTSLASQNHPIHVPLKVKTKLFFTLSINSRPCANDSCDGPFGERFLASVNNISFINPRIPILEAYYNHIRGVYGDDFPSFPPFTFNYTADFVPRRFWRPDSKTEVFVLDYNSTVEIVLQGTNTVSGFDHPMHLHGHSFYVVGSGFGNFNRERDPLNYNLVDPPLQNTIAVPLKGWTTIRFRANNPGVWFMHCHLEHHLSWGMKLAFIVKNGKTPEAQMLPPPKDRPRC